jgi:hypothetical protein
LRKKKLINSKANKSGSFSFLQRNLRAYQMTKHLSTAIRRHPAFSEISPKFLSNKKISISLKIRRRSFNFIWVNRFTNEAHLECRKKKLADQKKLKN